MMLRIVDGGRWRPMTLLIAFVLVLSALATGLAQAGNHRPDHGGGDGNDVEFVLTVLHNNDGESDLVPDEVEGGGFEKGAAYFKTKLEQARWESNRWWFGDFGDRDDRARRGNIFVSSGDNFLASVSFEASVQNGVYYDALTLDRLRYDAIALGNHDFDFGPDLLADFIAEGFRRPGRPPYVSANLDFSGEPALQALADKGVIVASTVVKERGQEIGIIGATTPNLPFISSPRNVVVDPNVREVVQAEIDKLERRGINKIVLISHLQDVEADQALAGELSGIDIMVAGGGDELLANPDDLLLPSDDAADVFGPYPIIAQNADGIDVPIVTTSGQYGYVGRLVVGFNDDGEVVAIDEDSSGPLRVVSRDVGRDGVWPNRYLTRKVVEPVQEFEAALASNIVADSEVALDGRRNTVRFEESNQGNLIADSQLWQASQLAGDFGVAVPDVALQNGGGIRNDDVKPAGPISQADTFDMVPFGNFVAVVPDIPRSQFKEILENAVSRNQPGDIPGGTGRFAQVAGFTFVYDASGTAQVLDADGNVTTPGTRVQTVTLANGDLIVNGGAVVPGDDLNVAIVDFLARGGDQYPFRGASFVPLGVSYWQALNNYIVAPVADGGLNGSITAADYP
ncbi:MAG: bifunctional metallophosphatase/5'-nucleotidase, partial [Acidimicrobiia bacterium]